MASLHAFALRQSLNLYVVHYRRPFAFCQFLCRLCHCFISRLATLVREHIRFTGFYISDNCRAFRRLLWAGNPCVHSLWHDPEVTTGFRCRFGSCVINPTFACHKLRPLNEASPFDSPCAVFPGEFVSLGSILLRFVLWALHKSVTRNAHQSRDTLNGESGGFKPQSFDITFPVALDQFTVTFLPKSGSNYNDHLQLGWVHWIFNGLNKIGG